jgi:hypothetical protein
MYNPKSWANVRPFSFVVMKSNVLNMISELSFLRDFVVEEQVRSLLPPSLNRARKLLRVCAYRPLA